ncbi:hypothetical protein A3K63_01880 [Candidatus Micrarchaeota archaeon RBG_16_49_10]|nr:MAG: hypothetical protein A3K63_01880 [Candidatus Micrarchaeota archaeon RBG_16_49_10]
MRPIKGEIRVLGFDDGPFSPKKAGKATVIGVLYRGGAVFDGAMRAEVDVDGTDGTETLVGRVNSSKHREQLRVLMLHGVTMGGFNVIDIRELSGRTGLPVIAVCRRKPDLAKIRRTLARFPDFEARWNAIRNAGKIFELEMENNKRLYFQFIGIGQEEAERIIRLTCTRSLVPEPLRVAHMIASALVKGESGYRA